MINTSSVTAAMLILCGFTLEAQQLSDTTFVADAKANAVNAYTQAIGVRSRLYTGSEYRDHLVSSDEYAFMHEDVMYGNVKYSGELYENVPLYYDLETDQVVTAFPHGNKVQLLREKVEYFEIDLHRFVLLDNNKVNSGFYDLLYDGKMKFYARRQKVLVMKMNGNQPYNTFEIRTKYFIYKDGTYHTVKSKRSVLGLMRDRKKEVKRLLRGENVRFRLEREKAIALLLKHYEQPGNPK